MRGRIGAAAACARLELQLVVRDWAFAALTIAAAVSLVALVSLFGLTGSRAPMALIDQDRSAQSRTFIEALDSAHHSFSLRPMSEQDAAGLLAQGRLVGSITIPRGFGDEVMSGRTVPVRVAVDNVDVDLTDDVQRALPAAIVDFGHRLALPGLRLRMVEHDAWPQDTGYVEYLVVSALALASFVVAAALAALSTAREWEVGTMKVWRMAPAGPSALLAGKVAVAGGVALLALAATALVIVLGYRLVPASAPALAGALLACAAIFASLGAWLGAVLRRAVAVVPLVFGLAIPLYLDSGALEPTRFDGDPVWLVAHISPLYYAVGLLEWAFHGLRVTPEPIIVDLLVLLGFGAAGLLAARATVGSAR